MASATKQILDLEEIKNTWISDVTNIVSQIEAWLRSDPLKPIVETNTTHIVEARLGAYDTPSIEADFGNGSITVEPVARNYPWQGSVQIQGWPTLRRVRLIQSKKRDEQWLVMTDSGVPLRQEWNEHNFHVLCQDLLDLE